MYIYIGVFIHIYIYKCRDREGDSDGGVIFDLRCVDWLNLEPQIAK